MKSAIFLDRDGVLCKDKNMFYSGKPITKPADFEWESMSKEALSVLSNLDFYLILVTNQSIIGEGLLDEETFHKINSPMYDELKRLGKTFDGIYFCAHKKENECYCRKPSPGMINQALEKLDIDLESSFIVGDKTSDVKLGKNVGCKTVLVKTGYGGQDKLYEVQPEFTFDNLYKFSKYLEELL